MDNRRLQMEINDIKCRPHLKHFQLYADDHHTFGTWPHYVWVGQGPRGHQIELRYSPNHPYREPDILLTPDVSETHHKLGDNICYIRPEQWSPSYRASTAIMLAYAYITKFYEGRLDE